MFCVEALLVCAHAQGSDQQIFLFFFFFNKKFLLNNRNGNDLDLLFVYYDDDLNGQCAITLEPKSIIFLCSGFESLLNRHWNAENANGEDYNGELAH